MRNNKEDKEKKAKKRGLKLGTIKEEGESIAIDTRTYKQEQKKEQKAVVNIGIERERRKEK